LKQIPTQLYEILIT